MGINDLCGIAGFTHINGQQEPERISACVRAISHRGGAKQGVWESSHVSLGAVLLHAKAGAEAPIVEEDLVVCFDGLLHNREELRCALESNGRTLAPASDAELALRAFERWGEGAFARMRGAFAAAFWIPSRRQLVLVRDRLGVRPLYFARHRGDLYFGSELKAILPHPEIPRELDLSGLTDYLSLNYVPGPRTLVDAVKKLPPGTWLRWESGNITTGVYWRLEMRPDPALEFDAAREELDRLLSESIRNTTPASGPVCVWLNQALDCSTVLHYAAQNAAGRLQTFGVLFHGRSEGPNREIARYYGAEHNDIRLAPEADVFHDIVYHSDEPGGDVRASALWYLAAENRKYSPIALCGRGADQVLGGALTYLADRYAEALRGLPAGLRKSAARFAGGLPAPSGFRLGHLIEGSLLDPSEAHFFWEGSLAREQQQGLRSGWDVTLDTGFPGPLPCPESTGVNRFLSADQLYFIPDDLLYSFDRLTLAQSVLVQLPFLDDRIVEFASRLPEDFKVRGNRLGVLLTALMKDRVPRSMLERRNAGREMPVDDWFRAQLRPLLLETITEENARSSGVLEWSALESSIKSHLEGRANLGYHLWGLVVLFLWMKRWDIQPPSRTVGSGSTTLDSLAM